ncbi:MAG: thioesterase family protein [bacterium]
MKSGRSGDRERLDPGPVREGEVVGVEEVRVRYAETDAQAVVYHANFLEYFEVGRTGWVRDAGFPYTGLEADGFALVVAEAHMRFMRPARYDEVLRIETRLSELRTRSCTFSYRVLRERTGEALVEGWTALVCLGPEGRAVPIPDRLARAMRARAAL